MRRIEEQWKKQDAENPMDEEQRREAEAASEHAYQVKFLATLTVFRFSLLVF